MINQESQFYFDLISKFQGQSWFLNSDCILFLAFKSHCSIKMGQSKISFIVSRTRGFGSSQPNMFPAYWQKCCSEFVVCNPCLGLQRGHNVIEWVQNPQSLLHWGRYPYNTPLCRLVSHLFPLSDALKFIPLLIVLFLFLWPRIF